MKNLILTAAAVVALTFATTTASADHYRHRHSYRHHGYAPVRVVPYHAYRPVPAYSGAYHIYPSPAYRATYHHNYHYAYPGYASGGIGIGGPRLSLYIGF